MDFLNHLSDGAVVGIVIFVSLAIFAALWWTEGKDNSDEPIDDDKTYPLE